MDLSSRVAVITGGANGIGYALAKQCLARGMHVVLADKDVSALCDGVEHLTQESYDVLGVVCDVTNSERVKHLAEQTLARFGRIDWLFNNAGITGQLGPLWDLPTANIHQVMDINLHGAIQTIKHFIPLMTHPYSRIINIASVYGLCTGSHFSSYVMSKHALVAMSECLHYDLLHAKKDHIKVSVACPSFAQTNLIKHSACDSEDKSHQTFSPLMARAKPAEDVAQSIIEGVLREEFYVLPDREAKGYIESRSNDILNQSPPTAHSLQKLIKRLYERAEAKA